MPGARRHGEDTLKWTGISLLYYLCATACLGQTEPAICPKHIETPEFPLLARQTRLRGEVTLSVTIDAEGKVQRVAAMPAKPNEKHAYQLLQDSAIENVRHWTFVKPPKAPYTEVIVYDYEDDPSLPPSGVTTKVLFDLPDHVRILTNVPIIDTNKSQFQR